MACIWSLEVTSAEAVEVCLTFRPFCVICVTQALEIVPDSGHLELFDPACFSQFSRALPAELPIKVPRGAAMRRWQWLSSLSDSTESSLTWKGKRGPRSDLDVIFYDRIKDLNQMLLLKSCSTSSRKKKSLLPVSIFQKRSWKIYKNWEESSKSYSDLWKSMSQSERLWTWFRSTGWAAQITPCH